MKKGNKIRRAISLAAVLFPLVMVAQQPATTTSSPARHEFTLQQAIDFADKNNVQVKNALLDLQIQLAQGGGCSRSPRQQPVHHGAAAAAGHMQEIDADAVGEGHRYNRAEQPPTRSFPGS